MITKVRTRRRKFQLSEMNSELREMNSELREMKFGLREMNFELREMNFELREMNFGLRELKFGLREINLSCEVLDSQSHRNIRNKKNKKTITKRVMQPAREIFQFIFVLNQNS